MEDLLGRHRRVVVHRVHGVPTAFVVDLHDERRALVVREEESCGVIEGRRVEHRGFIRLQLLLQRPEQLRILDDVKHLRERRITLDHGGRRKVLVVADLIDIASHVHEAEVLIL